jgi:hypothetical protein
MARTTKTQKADLLNPQILATGFGVSVLSKFGSDGDGIEVGDPDSTL